MTTTLTHKDLTIVSVAAIAVTICFALVAGLVGSLQYSYAQEDILVTENGTAVVPVTTTDALVAQVQSTMTAIMGLLVTAGSIISIVVGWIRSKTGDKIVAKDTNEWLETIFSQVRQKDDELRDVFRQFKEHQEQINTYVDIVKSVNPEVAKKYEELAPKLTEKLQETRTQVEEWQKQADRFYAVTPKIDPVGSDV